MTKNKNIFRLFVCVFYFSFLIFNFLALPASALSSNDLVDNANRYDGQVIEYQGEVIGDIMNRGGHAWINVSDGGRAIGIWVTKNLADQVKTRGDYNNIGDTVRIVGIFNRACAQHGGDLDIHANSLNVVSYGHPRVHTTNRNKLWIALFLFIGIVVLAVLPYVIKLRA
ncbi:MAG: DNA-binding protein [Candidatus Margulisiibacteriota bacterium]|nr:DNA-binding protein [Candidatus Margulisiibacteriota bacterium]